MKHIIQSFLGLFGYRLQSTHDAVIERDEVFMEIYKACKPYTLTTRERMYALYKAVKYVIKNNIPGDFVECGVWKGGSVMVMALTLKYLGAERDIWLYDTFEGMSAPTKEDVHTEDSRIRDYQPSIGTFGEVTSNVYGTGYPASKLMFAKGKVEETIGAQGSMMPNPIAILRLDTDWYESTKHELEHLYPNLSTAGVLIIDDYGAWAGAKKAVDEYFKSSAFLARIDHDSRLVVKSRI